MNIIFAIPGVVLLIGLFALIEGLFYHCNPLASNFGRKALIHGFQNAFGA